MTHFDQKGELTIVVSPVNFLHFFHLLKQYVFLSFSSICQNLIIVFKNEITKAHWSSVYNDKIQVIHYDFTTSIMGYPIPNWFELQFSITPCSFQTWSVWLLRNLYPRNKAIQNMKHNFTYLTMMPPMKLLLKTKLLNMQTKRQYERHCFHNRIL